MIEATVSRSMTLSLSTSIIAYQCLCKTLIATDAWKRSAKIFNLCFRIIKHLSPIESHRQLLASYRFIRRSLASARRYDPIRFCFCKSIGSFAERGIDMMLAFAHQVLLAPSKQQRLGGKQPRSLAGPASHMPASDSPRE